MFLNLFIINMLKGYLPYFVLLLLDGSLAELRLV